MKPHTPRRNCTLLTKFALVRRQLLLQHLQQERRYGLGRSRVCIHERICAARCWQHLRHFLVGSTGRAHATEANVCSGPGGRSAWPLGRDGARGSCLRHDGRRRLLRADCQGGRARLRGRRRLRVL